MRYGLIEICRIISLTILCIFSSACIQTGTVYSWHNLDKGHNLFGGGGYKITKLNPGVYRIYALTNDSHVENNSETAQEMWRDKATQVCGGDNFTEKSVFDSDQRHWEYLDKFMPIKVTIYQNSKIGTAVCLGSTDPSYFEPLIVGMDIGASEFRERIAGNTLSGTTEKHTKFDVYYSLEGMMYTRYLPISGGVHKNEDIGKWEVTEFSELCEKWNKWRNYVRNRDGSLNRAPDCYRIQIIGNNRYQMNVHGTRYERIAVLRAGDPEGLGPDTEQATFSADITGSYISNITGKISELDIKGRNPEVNLIQKGKNISGTYGVNGGRIWGEIEDGKIKFRYNTYKGKNGNGEWAFEPDNKKITGKWSSSWNYDGKWGLTKIE